MQKMDASVRGFTSKFWLMIGASAVIAGPALSQSSGYPVPPEINMNDENHVNLVSGELRFRIEDVVIGPSSKPLVHYIASSGSRFVNSVGGDAFNIFVNSNNGVYGTSTSLSVFMSGSEQRFQKDQGNIYRSVMKNGGVFEVTSSQSGVYIDAAGVRYIFDINVGALAASRIEYPDGLAVSINYEIATKSDGQREKRISSVVRSDGWMLKYSYGSNDIANPGQWVEVVNVSGVNLAYEYCPPVTTECGSLSGWPKSIISRTSSRLSIKIPDGSQHRFTLNSWGEITGYKPPSYHSQDKYTYQHCKRTSPYDCYVQTCQLGVGSCVLTPIVGKVSVSWRDGNQSTYGYTPNIAGHYWEYRSQSPQGVIRSVLGSTSMPQINYIKMGDLGEAYFETGGVSNRVIRSKMRGDLGEHNLTYDDRGNVLVDRVDPSDGSSSMSLIASYPATCVNPVTCNKPEWSEDFNGHRTDFQYDSVHGGLTKLTEPADSNGVRPEMRSIFGQKYAWLRNATGGFTRSTRPVWLLTSEAYCKTSVANGAGVCAAGSSDEVITTYEYEEGHALKGSNLLLVGVAVTVGGQTLRTCYKYDRFGNQISETQPKAGLASCQ